VADPADHCALNVALYGAAGHRWAMTERGTRHVARSPERFLVGPSEARIEDGDFVIRIDERQTPLPFRILGEVRLSPLAIQPETFRLDPAGRHRWRPVAPLARIRVTLEKPALSWEGHGYLDTNEGNEPIEVGFRRWDWSRRTVGGETELLYDATLRDGGEELLALRIGRDGVAHPFEPAPRVRLPRTRWWLSGFSRAAGGAARIRTVEDTPFYSRSLVEEPGGAVTGVHESADLDRFASAVVQRMLPFRMPRRG
jgi:carotenoid 1,2-hydratase